MRTRKIIVHLATSADGYIAGPDGDIEWLTNRPAPKGFYGLPKFTKSIDATILGRKTFDLSVTLRNKPTWTVMDAGGVAGGNVILELDATTAAVVSKMTQK